jgi:2-polyprenyl-3-methyl-5-hydroxy-6-metoxy-1,4-benzoquinol methylase
MAAQGRDFWERTAARYDRSMVVLGGPLEAMQPLLSAEVAGLDRVLEVAAGTGLVTRVLAAQALEVVATDYAAAMVAQLEERVRTEGLSNVSTRQLDLLALDSTERFDAVVASNVLHLLPDLGAGLDAMVGALRPGGRLIVPTYCHDETLVSRLTSRLMGLVGFPGQRRLTLARLRELLEARGLTVRQATLLPGLLPIGFVSAEHPPASDGEAKPRQR